MQSHQEDDPMRIPSRLRARAGLAAALLCLAVPIDARVTSITIDATTPIAGGPFGDTGDYVLVRGRAFGELDPTDRRNAGITDIDLVVEADGKVRYTAQ